jgi:mRNA interferase HicA
MGGELRPPSIGTFPGLVYVIKTDYTVFVKSSELKRWLAKQGSTFSPGKGSHLHVFLHGRRSIIPMHNRELSTGAIESIRKQLGLEKVGGK